MITDKDCMTYILYLEPEFKESYEKHLKYWDNESSLHLDMTEFSHFVASKLENSVYKNAPKIFDGIEFLLLNSNSDDEVKNAVCTCFLENLINYFSEKKEILEKFVPLLGLQSRNFCKGWDEFAGVKTPGLWDDFKFGEKKK